MNTQRKILVTGGAGYIGSHTVTLLLEKGYDVIVIDNFSNSDEKVASCIEKITNTKVNMCCVDIRDIDSLDQLFSNNPDICSVIHFAGLKSVGESVGDPLLYYDNNVCGTINLLRTMKKYNVKNFIFSSSATVYSPKNKMPVTEKSITGPINPYGQSKLMVEKICEDLYNSGKSGLNFIMLRYFNPIGAHPSGLIGEDPNGIPSNLMPYILQVMQGKLPRLNIYGSNYDTPDGTGVRDFIHVMDLAAGHEKALEYVNTLTGDSVDPFGCYEIFNLGTGNGYSVLEIVREMENVSGEQIEHVFTEKRTGDLATVYSDASKAKNILGWEAKMNLKKMCEDSWNWGKKD